MPFSPYHQFKNRKKIEDIVQRLKENNQITDQAYNDFSRYHPSLILKLRSAKYNLDRLEEKLTTTDIKEAADTTGEFMFQVNMYIDGFFYNSGSALDILSRILLTLFGQPLRGNIYFQTAHTKISQSHPGDPILNRIASPNWKQDFNDYRNTLTHELILAPKYHIEIDNTRGNPQHKIVFPLPDDPRSNPNDRRFSKNPNVLKYIKTNFQRIMRLINTVYGDVVQRATASANLPL